MLISCTSCKSKYLVNSADLKPEGRTVQCAKCGYEWYQNIVRNEEVYTEEVINASLPSSKSEIKSDNGSP